MTDWAPTIRRAIGLASAPGSVFAPAGLMEACAKEANPIEALFDNDKANELFDAFDTEFGFIAFAKRGNKPISETEFDRVVAVTRWFVRELVGWRKERDPSFSKLASFFVIATRLDEEGALWTDMPHSIGANVELAQTIAVQLDRIRFSMSRKSYSPSPIRDQEMIDQFTEADHNKDWVSLRYISEHYPFAMLSGVVLTQAIQFLSRFSLDLLTKIVRSVNQTPVAMQIVSTMAMDAAFVIARGTGNPYIQFASVARLFSSHRPTREMTESAENALVDLLLVVSDDAEQWSAWMKAFNAHPIQTQVMQPALGRCLANVDGIALEEYFRSIVLNTNDISRDAVTACLSAFVEVASEAKRQRAWQIAYARWSEWSFGEHDAFTMPTAIVTSALDYAIVGYVTECLDEDQRDQLITECLSQVEEAESLWHGSITDCTAFVYRALSRSQPFFHAKACVHGRHDWLMLRHVHVPEEHQKSLYWSLRYHMNQLKVGNQPAA